MHYFFINDQVLTVFVIGFHVFNHIFIKENLLSELILNFKF